MLTELENSIYECLSNAVEDSLIPFVLDNVLSIRKDNEIRLYHELHIVSFWTGGGMADIYFEPVIFQWQECKHFLRFD